MSKIIIIGNSHVGALKTGWDSAGNRFPGHDVSFFAAPRGSFSYMRLMPDLIFGLRNAVAPPGKQKKVSELVHRINGAETIDLKPASVVVWAGYVWPSVTVAELLSGADVDGIRETGARQRLSMPMFEAILHDLAVSAMPELQWHGWSAPALFLSLKPLPAVSVIEAKPDSAWGEIARDPRGLREALELFYAIFSRHLSARNIRLIAPPEAALSPEGLTRPEFARGSHRLKGVAHPDDEPYHMNADYGVLWLDSFFAMLDGVDAPVPVALCS